MTLASLRRLALGVGLILTTVHCSDDDDTPGADAASDAPIADAAKDSSADARDSSDASGGSAGFDGSDGRAETGGIDASGDGSAGSDASAGTDSGVDARVDASDASDARDASGDAEASTVPVEAAAEAGVIDAGADVPVVPVVEAGIDAEAAVPLPPSDGGATFAQVKQIFVQHCASCHSTANTTHLDLIKEDGLYERLVGPLPASQEGFCGVDGGADGGGAALRAIVPGDTGASYLYSKITVGPPAVCFARMPKVQTAGGQVGCDIAEADGGDYCLSQTDIDTIGSWIEADAPNN